MSRLFKNRYRIASTRLRTWDYSWNATYFVTICTRNRICHFGNVIEGIMQLSEIGMIAERCWLEIPDHFPFVKLGNHIVMPNHVHGIVIIDRHGDHHDGMLGGDGGGMNVSVETQNIASLPTSHIPSPPPPNHDDTPKNKFGPQSQNLASIIRGFKIGVTKNARLIHPDFGWQPRYHDRIVRDSRAYHRISEYITNNPRQWREDPLFI